MPAELTSLTLHLRIAGVLLLLVAAMHVFMPGHFAWPVELQRLSAVNRQIFISHTLFIMLLLILTGILKLCFAPLLLEPAPLARTLLAGMAIFWLAKCAGQIALLTSAKWRSERFGLPTQLLFSALWAYIGGVNAAAWITGAGYA
jgi:hypothetical protein